MLFMLREIRIVLSDSKQHSDIKENIPIYAEKKILDDNADVHGHTLCYEVKIQKHEKMGESTLMDTAFFICSFSSAMVKTVCMEKPAISKMES